MTQQLSFAVLSKNQGFEIRQYSPFTVIEVTTSGDWLDAGNRAFRPLVNYISGANSERQKFAMTAPVLQASADPQRHTVSFVLPVDDDQGVPLPADSSVKLVRHEGGVFAAKTFRGRWSETLFSEQTRLLADELEKAGIAITGTSITARYDPPWKPGFARRNEILLPVRLPITKE